MNEEEKKLIKALLEQIERLNSAIVVFSQQVSILAELADEGEDNPLAMPNGAPQMMYN